MAACWCGVTRSLTANAQGGNDIRVAPADVRQGRSREGTRVSANAASPSEEQIVSRSKSLVVARRETEGEIVYTFTGRCVATDPAFQNELDRLADRISEEEKQPVLNLAKLELANSAFVSLIAKLVVRLDRRGLRLVVLKPDRRTRDLFAIVGFLEALDVREE